MLRESEWFFLDKIKESLELEDQSLTEREDRLLASPYPEIQKAVMVELTQLMAANSSLTEREFEMHKENRERELRELRDRCVQALHRQYELEITVARNLAKSRTYGENPSNVAWEWRSHLQDLDKNSNRLLVAVVSDWYQKGGGRQQEKKAAGCATTIVLTILVVTGIVSIATVF